MSVWHGQVHGTELSGRRAPRQSPSCATPNPDVQSCWKSGVRGADLSRRLARPGDDGIPECSWLISLLRRLVKAGPDRLVKIGLGRLIIRGGQVNLKISLPLLVSPVRPEAVPVCGLAHEHFW